MGDGENHRELTLILYLNGPGKSGTGGALRCHVGEEEVVDVDPRPGRLVVFRARELLHEVLPVDGWQRAAMSVWLLRDARRGD